MTRVNSSVLRPVARPASARDRRRIPRIPGSRIQLYVLGCDSLRAAGIVAVFEKSQVIDVSVIDDMACLPSCGREPDSTLNIVLVGPQGGTDILQLIESIHFSRPDLLILVMSHSCGEEAILSVLMQGAKGMLHDTCTAVQLEKAVHLMATGSIWAPRRIQAELIGRLLAERKARMSHPIARAKFTHREQQVLDLLLDGRSNREIARELEIEERTVKSYVTSLMRKMGVRNRTALSMRAQAQSMEIKLSVPVNSTESHPNHSAPHRKMELFQISEAPPAKA